MFIYRFFIVIDNFNEDGDVAFQKHLEFHRLTLKFEANDLINFVQGVGGSESVYEKKIDSVKLDVSKLPASYSSRRNEL